MRAIRLMAGKKRRKWLSEHGVFSYQGRWQRKIVVLTCLLILGAIAWLFPKQCFPFLPQDSLPQGYAQEPGEPPFAAFSTFQITFEEMGYGEEVLESPVGQKDYTFRLPANWLVEPDSYLDLELSYFFTELEQKKTLELSSFGELSIMLDDSLLSSYALNTATLEQESLRVDLPPDLLNEQPGRSHSIDIMLDAWFLCDVAHKGELVVRPESTLFFNYTPIPPQLDLANYPRPFSQNSFELDYVRFALPAQPSEAEVRTATALAAGLSDLAGGNMIISATTDVDWLRLVEAGQAGFDHLVVIGRPDRNRLIPWLSQNEGVSLPVSLHSEDLVLSTEGPKRVIPGEVFTYRISITNTTYSPTQNFTLTDYLPRLTDLVRCNPECLEYTVSDEAAGVPLTGIGYQNKISWLLPPLSWRESAAFSITLQLRNVQHLSATLSLLENTVVLLDAMQKPINVSSLSTVVTDDVAVDNLEEELVGSSVQSDYFFMQEDQPVPEGDGILQEILSPWDPQKAVLVVTGLSDAAVHKAAQALNLETGLLDMEGPSALIRDVQPSPPLTETWVANFTFSDLGYGNRLAYGIYPRSPEINYWFDVPRGWHYTNEARLHLRFTHSEVIDMRSSTLSVLLNGSPLATVPLTQTSATEGSLEVDLPSMELEPGSRNKISLHPIMQAGGGAECQLFDIAQAWFKVSQNSSLRLGQRVESVDILDLDFFPSPFNDWSDMREVLLVLPPDPTPMELEALFHIASIFGRATGEVNLDLRTSLGMPSYTATLQSHHIVAIGRPSRNPLIQDVNALLPQPFVPGTDEVENQVGEVILRLPPDIALGYVQELQSPWNEERVLLVVTGTRDEGVTWAAFVLNRQSWRLDGNLALVRQDEEDIEVRSFDTRRLTSSGQAGILLTAVPDLTSVVTATVTPTIGADAVDITPVPTAVSLSDASATKNQLPIWVVGFLGVTGVTIVVILAVGVWRLRQQRRN